MTLPGALAPLLAEPRRTGVLSDFDGTLAPIVDDPRRSRPLDGVPAVLGDLVPRVGRVAVISGRPARFLLEHLGGTGVSIWGLYGLEHAEGDRVLPVPEAEEWRDTVSAAVARARADVAEVNVEDKGLALVLHFRTAPQHGPVAQDWAEQTAAATGLELHPGRMSYELRPPVPHGKGAALERAVDGLGAACFFGDDHGDLDAFEALDRFAAAGMTAVRIGVKSEESPEELLQRADITVDGPEGVLGILTALRDGIGST